MDNLTNELNRILSGLEQIGEDMKTETTLWEMELKERQRLGITNEEQGLKHFIEFMKAHGYDYEKK